VFILASQPDFFMIYQFTDIGEHCGRS